MRLDDEQTERQLLAGRLNMLFRDRRVHAYTRHLMVTEARMSREAWETDCDFRVAHIVRQLGFLFQLQYLCQHGLIQREDRPEVTLPPRKRLDIALGRRYEVRDSSSAAAARPAGDFRADYGFREVGYGITNSWDEIVETLQGAPASTDTELGRYVTTLQGQQGLAGDHTQPELPEEAGGTIIPKQVLEGWSELLVNAPTPTLLNVNHYLSKAPKELPVFLNGVKEWSPSFTSATAMFSEEADKIEKYVGGLLDMIHGSVVASKPKTMQEAIEIATELMDKKIRTFVERETASKRKFENTSRNTQNQQQQHSNNRQNTGRVYTAASGEKKQYGGSRPLCAKCNYHHDGPCASNQRGTGLGQKTTCHVCGVQGHFRRECPKLKNNNNHGNQGGRNNAPARVYAVGRAGIDPDANVVTGTFLLNNRYASILFDNGADRSFVSATFSTQINIMPSTLDHCYDVELADERIIELNTILRGCTLNLLNHPFNIDLMPVELGSFDAIICMDWLAKYQAVIVCAEKIVRIPWGKETLIIHGDGSNRGNATRLNIISCTKTEKYVKKGFSIFSGTYYYEGSRAQVGEEAT
nr:hypothetical protein [Tanacetum cinerariifolium]